MLVPPQVCDGAQRHQQRGWADQHNIVFQRFGDKFWLSVQCQQKCRFDRDKHQHIIQRAQPWQLLIIFSPQQANVISYRGDVLLECGFSGEIIFCIEVALIGHQRHFGVNHHVFALRQAHDDIGLHSRSGVGFNADLRFVFIPLAQTRGFQHAGEHHFAPVTLRFIVALERTRQVDRLLRHLRIQLLEITDFMRQGVAFTRLLAKAVLHLTTKTIQLFTQGGQQTVQTLTILLINAAVALLKDTVSQIFKLLAQALLAVDHLTDFVFSMQLG
ncbi:hypothetical protein D3C80_1105530 [compost metagenome]